MKLHQHLLRAALLAILSAAFLQGCSRASKVERKLASAQSHYLKSNHPAAEIEFKNVLAIKPGHPLALKGLGMIRLKQGAILEAGRMLAAAKQKLPADDEVRVGLAMAMLDLGFVGDARTAVLELLDRSPSHAEALMLLAESSFTPEAMTECEDRIARSEHLMKDRTLLPTAILELRRGKIASAEEVIGRAIEADPGSARALAMKATVLRYQRQPESALETMKMAAELAGLRSKESDHYAWLLMELGHRNEAISFLEAATRKAPGYLPAWRILGQIAFTEGNEARAGECLAKVLAGSPLDIEAGILQAKLWLRQKKTTEAVELLEKLAKTFPSRPLIEMPLATALAAAGNLRKAADTLDHVIAIAPKATQAAILRARIDLKESQFTEAIHHLEPVMKIEPDNRAAQDLLVQAYCADKRMDDAITILKQQSAKSPDDPEPLFQTGRLLLLLNDPDEARAAFEQTLKRSAGHLGALSQLAAMDMREGNAGSANARADDYLASHPDSPEGTLLKASLSYAQKDIGTAETMAEKAIQLKPDDVAAHALLVRIHTELGKPEEALECLRQLIRTHPTNLAARMHLGSLLQSLGRSDEARTTFEDILKMAPDSAPACNNLAVIESAGQGDAGKALAYARKAHELAPDDPSICDTLGWIEWQRGNYGAALPLLRRASEGLPRNASVLHHLAMAQYMMNRTADAIRGFESAIAIEGTFPERAEALKRLRTLQEIGTIDSQSIDERLKADPKDVVLLLRKAAILAETGRAEDALEIYQQAVSINPDLEAAYIGMAKIHATRLNQPDKAFEFATMARKVAPQSPHAAAELGVANFRIGNHPQAYVLLQESARKLQDDDSVQYDYAWAAYGNGFIEESRSAMTRVASTNGAHSDEARDFLTLTATNSADMAGIRTLADDRLAKNPNDVPALMTMASIQAREGLNPAEQYRKVIGLYPGFPQARVALARTYLADPARLDEAEKLANDARGKLTDDPELSSILGIVNFHKGKFEYASQLLQELALKRQLTGTELFALGMCQASIKRPDEAVKSLTEAIRSGLPDADAAKATSKLDELAREEGSR